LAAPAACSRALGCSAGGACAHGLPQELPDLPACLHNAFVSILALATLTYFSDPALNALDDLRIDLSQVKPVLVLYESPVNALQHALLDQRTM